MKKNDRECYKIKKISRQIVNSRCALIIQSYENVDGITLVGAWKVFFFKRVVCWLIFSKEYGMGVIRYIDYMWMNF